MAARYTHYPDPECDILPDSIDITIYYNKALCRGAQLHPADLVPPQSESQHRKSKWGSVRRGNGTIFSVDLIYHQNGWKHHQLLPSSHTTVSR